MFAYLEDSDIILISFMQTYAPKLKNKKAIAEKPGIGINTPDM